MFLGRVKGHVVATAKDTGMKGRKFLIVEPLKVEYADESTGGRVASGTPGSGKSANRFENTGRAIVALDSIGAGEGQLVLITQGSSARMAEGMNKVPVDAVVIGMIDEAVVLGEKIV